MSVAASPLATAGVPSPVARATTHHRHKHKSKPKTRPRVKVKAGPLSGTWSGQYGGAFSGTFTLKWTEIGSKLSGTIALSGAGTATVHGTISGSSISFGTVGGANVITYTGSVSGSSMSGSYNTPRGGGSWSAHKTS